jgi:hypothetical protein
MRLGKRVALTVAWGMAILPVYAAPATPTAVVEKVVYADDLTPDQKWSEPALSTTPDVQKVRGPFWSQTVTLSLNHLPVHSWVKVSLKLLVRGTWDGSNKVWGPDLWSLTARGGPRLIFASICNLRFGNNDQQSFPDDYPLAIYPSGTGASHDSPEGDLGEAPAGTAVMGAPYTTYPIEVIFPHSERKLNLDFAGIYDDPELEQAWALKDVKVEVRNGPESRDNEELEALWQDLASDDGVKANAALWKFVGAGNAAILFIAEKVAALDSASSSSSAEETQANSLRLHRADRILRIIGGASTHDIRFVMEHHFLEYGRP